ncbi:MAG TPA: serine hydrolase [Desulfomonilaceae bacterium]|nr:serine hydrolase [Desulfomonilaceae bacterium]
MKRADIHAPGEQTVRSPVNSDPPQARQVTKEDWLEGPNITWSLQHTSQFFPTRQVTRATAVAELPVDLKDLDNLPFEDSLKDLIFFGEFIRRTDTDAIIVLHKGKIIYERYENGMTPETRHLLFSASKSFLGLVTAVMVSQGMIGENDSISHCVPELAASAYSDATLRQVLDMRVGVKFSEAEEDYTDLESDIVNYLRAADWVSRLNYQGPTDLHAALLSLKELEGPHGGNFCYKSPCSDVLAWVLSKASGKSLSELLSELIWSKIGSEREAYYLVDPLGKEAAFGGLNVTLRDFARFGEMMRQMGNWHGCQVVPENVVKDIMNGGDCEVFANGNRADTRPGWSYRSHWWITHNRNGAYAAFGVHGQWLYIDPKAQFVVAKFGSQLEPSDASIDALHLKAFEALATAL